MVLKLVAHSCLYKVSSLSLNSFNFFFHPRLPDFPRLHQNRIYTAHSKQKMPMSSGFVCVDTEASCTLCMAADEETSLKYATKTSHMYSFHIRTHEKRVSSSLTINHYVWSSNTSVKKSFDCKERERERERSFIHLGHSPH